MEFDPLFARRVVGTYSKGSPELLSRNLSLSKSQSQSFLDKVRSFVLVTFGSMAPLVAFRIQTWEMSMT